MVNETTSREENMEYEINPESLDYGEQEAVAQDNIAKAVQETCPRCWGHGCYLCDHTGKTEVSPDKEKPVDGFMLGLCE